ncbi:MAG: PQQ-binding-like beta-propeller repeat protein [Planctomycetota bacterium]
MIARAPVPLVLFALLAPAQEWTNSGGNARRNGLSPEFGPLQPQVLWNSAPGSIIAWQPIVAEGLVFAVRQTGFPPGGEPGGSPVFALDLDTGGIAWTVNVPYAFGDWTTWLLGYSDGKVYASRAGNGASVQAQVHAYDAATGAVAWTSVDAIDAGAYDGVVFAPDGDLIVASFRTIWRIRASDGTTAWTASRLGSVSGNCGAAVFGDAVYVADAAPGGNVIKRYDLATGAFRYQGPLMPGFLSQHTPMVGADGTIYYNRAQNNATVDFFYAFDDDGSAITQRWSAPSMPGAGAEYGVGPDGSVYMVAPGEILTRRDAATGAVLDTWPTALGASTTRFAIDADGRVFVSNGGFATGTLFSFEADLTPRWSLPVPNINIGGPCLARDGTLVVAGVGGNVTALRTPSPWTQLGGGIAGAGGVPALRGRGSLTVGNTVTLTTSGGPAGGFSWLIVGLSAVNVPAFGGTLVPSPDLVEFVPLDPAGGSEVAFPWFAGVAVGTPLWWQVAILDPAAPFGVAATDALRSAAN